MSKSKTICCVFLLAGYFAGNSYAQDSWSQGADMLAARYWHCVGEANGKIYAIGGSNAPSTAVEEYNPVSDTWTKKSPMPTGRGYISGCAVNNKIYAIGGYYKFVTFSTVEEYDPSTDTWADKSPLPEGRWGYGIAAVKGKIYVIGGARDWPWKEIYSAVLEYDPLEDTWTTRNSMPTPRWGLSCCVVNDTIYAIGGFSDQGVTPDVEVYDPATDTWINAPSMPTKRWSLATAALNGKIYAFGGGDVYPPTTAYKTVEEYNPKTNSWTTKTPMPAGRISLAACSMNGKIYIPGGSGPGSVDKYSDVYIYDPGNITGVEDDPDKPANLILHQNYPNPFILTTDLSFEVQKSCFVMLTVYNSSGRKMSTLVNQHMNKGFYTVQFDGSGLPPGIYFIRIDTDNSYETIKILLTVVG